MPRVLAAADVVQILEAVAAGGSPSVGGSLKSIAGAATPPGRGASAFPPPPASPPGMAAPPHLQPPTPSRIIDSRYEILGTLGQGGMGVVYEGRAMSPPVAASRSRRILTVDRASRR